MDGPVVAAAEPVAREWFDVAIGTAGDPDEARSDGAGIRYRRWGPSTGRGVVLVHGAAAHSSWWDHIAPLLAPDCTVLALDLSGHGDSGRRERYTVDGWAAEVLAVADHAGLLDPVVVGHSMGGGVALAAGGESLAGAAAPSGVVALDTVVRPEGENAAPARVVERPPLKIYPDETAALRRFRTVPAQPAAVPFVLDHIARASVCRVRSGWTWRFDPRIFDHDRLPVSQLAELSGPAVLVVAEHGILDGPTVSSMLAAADPAMNAVAMPGAHHHMMIDKPLETLDIVRRCIAAIADDAASRRGPDRPTPLWEPSSAQPRGRPSPRSPTMLRWMSLVPAPMVTLKLSR